MSKQKTLSPCAAIMATLVFGTAFSMPLSAATGGPIRQVSAGGTASAAESFVDSYRAYPASCLADGLPFGKSSAYANAQTVPVFLYAYNSTAGGYTSEADSVSVWRVPCSGGVAATVLEFDRPSTLDGSVVQYPEVPFVSITTAASGTTSYTPRLAREPNTLFGDTAASTYFYSSTIYVLEYYNPGDPNNPTSPATSASVDYNQAFTLSIENQGGGSPLVINVPAYVPPTNPLMEISGYLSTNWSNPNQTGEGMVVQVYDNGDQKTRTLSFAWFTFDDQNLPFWLYGQASLNIGDTSVTAQTIYLKGGTFAYNGNVLFPVPSNPWGTVTFTFPDCGHMNIAYNGDASAVNGPKGNASAQFVRVADVANLGCQ
ncbi:MAG: hypothetical protein P4L92_23395 [Rudaea sp.]|nr:hypothetical protein [Rudaea sp.]